MNICIFSGRLGQDPELRYTPSGKEMVNFSIAVRGSSRDDTTWVRCVAFGKTALMISKVCTKGSMVTVNTSLSISTRDEKTYTNFIVNTIDFQGEINWDGLKQEDAGESNPVDEIPF